MPSSEPAPIREMTRPPPGDLPALLRHQGAQCGVGGSAIYERLLLAAAADVEEGGPCLDVLRGHERDPWGSALALRFLGGVHRLVLDGGAPALAAYYPSAGGSVEAGDPWLTFRATVADNVDLLRERLAYGVQTNEVGRAAALAPGFLTVAVETGLPLRMLEVGTSAALNLRWDRFHYQDGDAAWGDPESLVRLESVWTGTPRPWSLSSAPPSETAVVERAGCDPSPIDPTDDDGRQKLRSFVWPEQLHRLALLDAAITIARDAPATIDVAPAATWLGERLAEPAEGCATVVYHSIVMQYMNKAARAEVAQAIADAGNRATTDAPVAWYRMEPGWIEGRADLTLTTWPGGNERLIGRTGYHGVPVEWAGPNGIRR